MLKVLAGGLALALGLSAAAMIETARAADVETKASRTVKQTAGRKAAPAKKKATPARADEKSCGTFMYRDKTGKCIDARNKPTKKS